MSGTRWLAVLSLALLGAGALWHIGRPSPKPALDCGSASVRFRDGGGLAWAVCSPQEPQGAAVPVSALTLGTKLDLNRVGEAELASVPGVGRKLAGALVEARTRRGAFASWEEVDQVKGVGPAKLELLRQATFLKP